MDVVLPLRSRGSDYGVSFLSQNKFFALAYLQNKLAFSRYVTHIIGVARIFDWGGPKPQITRNDVIRNFRKSNFLWDEDIVEWKI